MRSRTVALCAMAVSGALVAQPALSATKTTKKKAAPKTTAKTTPKATTLPTAAPTTPTTPQVVTTAPAAAASDVDPNGTLRIAAPLTPNTRTVQFDPTRLGAPTVYVHTLVYDTLLRQDTEGRYSPGLATAASVDSDKQITVDLRPNLKFSDGTPLDAAAAKFGIERNLNNFSPFAHRTDLRELSEVVVVSPTKFQIKLKTPVAGYWYQFLAGGETALVSPAAVQKGQDLQTKPVGAGPYTLESLVPESKIVFKKNPNYYAADKVRTTTIEYIHVADPTAMSNALQSGAADMADNVSIVVERSLRGKAEWSVRSEKSDDLRFMAFLCKREGPLANEKVRRALSLAVDRDAINRIVYEGKSEIMDSLVSSTNSLYDRKYKGYNGRNIDQAKRLLAEAGYPNGFRLDFFYAVGDSQTATEVLQQNWKDVGVDLNIALSVNTTADFFTPNPRRAGLISAVPRVGIDIATRTLVGPSVGNTCGYNDDELNRVVDLIKGVSPDSAEYKRYWGIFNDVVMDKTAHLFLTFGIYRNVHNNKTIGGQAWVVDSGGIPSFDLANMYKKK